MSTYLTSKLRLRLIEADNQHCAYCHTREAITGQPMTIDHVIPESQGGLTEFDNLCFCCRRCNEFKGTKITAPDPLTGEVVSLYHPRLEKWHEHFAWDETGTLIVGLTAMGRATVTGLNMNDLIIIAARRRWVVVGWHPPDF
ncbi:HNH endonuclease [Desulfobacterales bacterium HSG17]|nr:HNH endonuclease [Desulfobacterales bacterium HSG17]